MAVRGSIVYVCTYIVGNDNLRAISERGTPWNSCTIEEALYEAGSFGCYRVGVIDSSDTVCLLRVCCCMSSYRYMRVLGI
jgi:hypothetical protein